MKNHFLSLVTLSMILTFFISCKDGGNQEENEVQFNDQVEQPQTTSNQETKEMDNTQLVSSGTYTGEAIIVDSEQKEIYVKLNDTTTIELYFSNDTQVMKNNQPAGFDALQKGQTVEVEVERSGESLNPKTIRIVENR